jgi:hypothetical protein
MGAPGAPVAGTTIGMRKLRMELQSSRDPEWVGALEKPDPQRSENAFVGRYAYVAPTAESAGVPIQEASRGRSEERLQEALPTPNWPPYRWFRPPWRNCDGAAFITPEQQTAFKRSYGPPARKAAQLVEVARQSSVPIAALGQTVAGAAAGSYQFASARSATCQARRYACSGLSCAGRRHLRLRCSSGPCEPQRLIQAASQSQNW